MPTSLHEWRNKIVLFVVIARFVSPDSLIQRAVHGSERILKRAGDADDVSVRQ